MFICIPNTSKITRTLAAQVIAVAIAIGFASNDSANDILAVASEHHPNVVVILTDDQGWGDLSLNGNPNLSTPNIDSLARDGAEVKNYYVCAVCSPTRAELLTGRYHTRSGVYSTSSGGERINADEQTIGDVFKTAGYATAAFGKWHSGMQYPYHPNARGFDEYYGFCSGHWGDYFSPMLEHNGEIVTGEGFLVDDLTSHAIEFIDGHVNDPFFVYLPFNTPHAPMQVPDPFWEKFKDKPLVPDPDPKNAKAQDDNHTRAALAMCENIDFNVGRLLKHLDETGLANNTLVVFFCDNGPNGYRFNGGLRGRKGSTNEGGLRSPMLVRYPTAIKKGTKVTSIMGAIDLLPTLAELTKIKLQSPKPLDGRSMAAGLLGQPANDDEIDDRMIFSTWNGRHSLRSNQYRMHGDGSLYDIQDDRGEHVDLRNREPEIAKQMGDVLASYVAELNPKNSKSKERRPITLGHPDAQFNQMPARDAIGHGGVVHSNKFPNCTFMKNWVGTDSSITWDVDILGEGDHEVTMYYACKNDDVGSVIELSLGDEKLQATISEANEVPLRGMENDRDLRPESYVKDWKPMTLGTFHLKPGRGTLTLKAIEAAGGEVAEMRLLMFRKLP
ncbi:arylsulfatase [Rubripirellula reticaptiva]|uniref:Arylsulfatase n=1 Tax=Rubripirellula reticaptiva TaxID=2528013 RepID=A0A5C6EGA4_9BACT|nr:arylsulfatase [Rubripirellula reticaptiva]TWU48012.1 Arylsulfatase [Rubripirellula reticaptiva]